MLDSISMKKKTNKAGIKGKRTMVGDQSMTKYWQAVTK
jgi:hypothetical protein